MAIDIGGLLTSFAACRSRAPSKKTPRSSLSPLKASSRPRGRLGPVDSVQPMELRDDVVNHHQVERFVAATRCVLFPAPALGLRLGGQLLEPDVRLLFRAEGMREMHVPVADIGALQLAGKVVLVEVRIEPCNR